MVVQKIKRHLCGILCVFAGITFGLVSCVDDSYDMSKDIDLTMGLGSEGLQLKIGDTERVMLGDILEVDDEEMIGETSKGLYYLIKEGETDFTFDVSKVKTHIEIVTMTPDLPLLNMDRIAELTGIETLPFKAGDIFDRTRFGESKMVTAEEDLGFSQHDVPEEVVSIKRMEPADKCKHFRLFLKLVSNEGGQQDFVISSVKDLQVTLPNFIKSSTLKNQVLTVPDFAPMAKELEITSFELDAFELPGDLGYEMEMFSDGTRGIDITEKVSMSGDVQLKAMSDFVMKKGDFTNVRLIIRLDGDKATENHINVEVEDVTGRYNPLIDPEVDPLEISNDLPDFLKDEDVVIDVANPTFRFNIQMKDIPVSINFSGDVEAVKDGKSIATVKMPTNGKGLVTKNEDNVLYFYQGNEPFDPEGIRTGSKAYEVENLSSLIRTLPDEIRVNFGEGRVQVTQNELHTVHLGVVYDAVAHYSVFVPFSFNSGLRIVYNDSTDSMNDDVKDFAAEGAMVTANIVTTIPLALKAKVIPMGVNGKELTGVEVSEAVIPAAVHGEETTSPIEISLKFKDPNTLSQLDKLKFRIEANGAEQGGQLTSQQYLQVKEMRLRLMGQVIGNFN